ncbi:MAG TPA: hypothetical protein VG125_11950 [Pirellulales bacterium]|jgi:hypothetical protein|nr:hypothetical protein [Pirellulales bacterium]
MDRRFWQTKRTIPWLNTGETVCPAFNPITFCWDNNAGVPSPWQQGTTLLSGGRLALPSDGAAMSETGYALTLYAINGPFDVQPGSYGECSIDYPLPIRYDPNSFPIPDPADPANPVPGTWDKYITAYPGDIEGPPLLGFVSSNPTNPNAVQEAAAVQNVNFQPASFMADFTPWSVLYWMPNPDGSMSDNLALVVPTTGLGPVPYGGSIPAVAGTGTNAAFNVPIQLLQPQTLTVKQAGLYALNVSATVEIDSPGAAVALKLQLTYGPAWANFNIAGTPIAATVGSPIPGQVTTLLTGGRQVPRVTVSNTATDVLNVNVGGTNYQVTGDMDNFQVNFTTYGYETVWFNGYVYLLPGDEVTLVAVLTAKGTDQNGNPVDPVGINVEGALTWIKQGVNPFGSFGVLY